MDLPELTGDEMRDITSRDSGAVEKAYQLPATRAELARLRGRLWHFATKNNRRLETTIKGGTLLVRLYKKV
jgi:hypothetical protein